MNECEFSNTVVGGAFVVAETNMEVGGGCRVTKKGRLIEETAVFVKIEEILLDEREGLAGAGTLRYSCEG